MWWIVSSLGLLLLRWNTTTKATQGGKGLLCLHIHYHHMTRTQAEIEPGDRGWCRGYGGAAYWPTLQGLLSLFSYRTQDDQPKDGTINNGLTLSYQSLINKINYSWILWRHFLSSDSLLSDKSTLGQVDIKLSRKDRDHHMKDIREMRKFELISQQNLSISKKRAKM